MANAKYLLQFTSELHKKRIKDLLYELQEQPKKEWVGLTDEEVNDILKLSKDAHEATKRIEAKLKEKNI